MTSEMLARTGRGIKAGLGWASVAILWTLAIWLIDSDRLEERVHLPLPTVVCLYLAAGVLSGGIAGALRPWREGWFGSAVCGVLAALPSVGLLYTTVFRTNPERYPFTGEEFLFVWLLASLIMGVGYGVIEWWARSSTAAGRRYRR